MHDFEGTYLDLVAGKTASKTDEIVRAVSTLVLVFFTACRALQSMSARSFRGSHRRTYDDVWTFALIMTGSFAVHADPALICSGQEGGRLVGTDLRIEVSCNSL